jgi:lipid II:glycine glycyltransferase (peptidoglycan interpeptide bridge formation enzyme)
VIREIDSKDKWDKMVKQQGGHPLQLWAWGELKEAQRTWTAFRLAVEQGGKIIGSAQVLSRRLPRPFGRLFYIPRGPFCHDSNREKVLQELAMWAREQGGVALKIEPDWTEMKHWPSGWRHSKNRILVPKTALIDLAETEAEILADATKKTRQYIRKSANSGVTIRRISSRQDIAKCLDIYHRTARQRKFGLHDDSYYYDLARLAGGDNRIYLAEKDGQPLSFLWNLRTPAVEFELYGGANEAGQQLRSNYTLKWQAISQAKNHDVKTYDMNGLLNDGISHFKRSFTSSETDWVGTWDKPLSPLYLMWESVLPAGKKIVQKLNHLRGKSS